MSEVNQATYAQSAANVSQTYETPKKSVSGATYGDAKLSDKGLEYYNKLKEKYGNMNFVLVAADKKEEAEAIKGSFANGSKLTVLIDTDKIEKMATDDAYRQKYEAILDNATSGLSQMKSQLGSQAGGITAYGMTVKDDGTASFFAVIDKSLAAQRERIEKHAAEKAAAKKADDKAALKEKTEERIHGNKTDDTVTITANSVEELQQKIDDYYMQLMSDTVITEEEKKVGQSFDFSV